MKLTSNMGIKGRPTTKGFVIAAISTLRPDIRKFGFFVNTGGSLSAIATEQWCI